MANVVSDTPGRLRIRVRPERRRSDFMQRVQAHVGGKHGIKGVETNANTGSVTVKYDPSQHSSADVWSMLRDLGVVAETVTGEDLPGLDAGGSSETGAGIVNAVSELDQQIAQLTGHKVDLKVIVPLGLGTLGAVQIAQNGLQFAEVPGYILIWYAFDTFFKLHVQAQRPSARGEEARGEARANGRSAHHE